MPRNSGDINDMIKEIEEKIAELERQKGSDRGGCPTDPPSNAMVVVPG